MVVISYQLEKLSYLIAVYTLTPKGQFSGSKCLSRRLNLGMMVPWRQSMDLNEVGQSVIAYLYTWNADISA